MGVSSHDFGVYYAYSEERDTSGYYQIPEKGMASYAITIRVHNIFSKDLSSGRSRTIDVPLVVISVGRDVAGAGWLGVYYYSERKGTLLAVTAENRDAGIQLQSDTGGKSGKRNSAA